MSDDAEFKAIFTGDNSQLKTSVDETLAYLSKLVNGAYDVGTSLQNPVEMLQKFNQVSTELSSNFKVIDQLKELVLAATDVSPILARISEFTGINFLEADANIAVFKNGLLQLNSESLATKSAFAGIAEQVGKDNPILLDYAKVLQLVNADLSSFIQTSSFFSIAQSALKDPIQLAALAMEQFDSKIVNTAERLVSLVSELDTTGVKFTSLESYITSIANEYKHAEAAILGFSEANAGNNIKIEMAIQRLQQYFTVVEELKTSVRGYIQIIQDAGRADEVFVNKKGEAVTQSRMLTTELGAITKVLLDEDAITQVLNGTQDVSLKTVLSLMEANRSSSVIYKELLTLLPQVTTEITTLTGVQKLLIQLVEDLTNRFGSQFANALQDAASQVNLTGEGLLVLYSRIVNVAEAITSLLSQSEGLVNTFITQVQSQDASTLSLEKQATVIMQVIEWYARFKTELLSIGSIQNAMVGEQNNQTQALLTYEGVLNSATGVYDGFLSASKDLVVVQKQTAQATQEGIDPVERLVLAKERLRRSLGPLIEGFSTLLSTLKSFAVFTAASAIISGITDAFRSVISSASDFDQTLHSLKAITGSTSSEMAGMNDVIKNMAANSTYSIEAIGKGLQNMAQAGFTVEESANAIHAATNLAMGTLEKLENTVDLLTSTLVSYGLSSLEAGRVSDVLATAVNQSKLSIDGLRTSLNYVGVIASQSGLSLQETTASLMVLADRGMKASTMGTGLRQVLDKLISPNEKLRDAYQAHGIELDKISPLTAGYETAIKNLATALWDSETQTVNTSKAFELFGIRGAQAAAILIKTYVSGEWKESLNSLDQAGTAAKMAAEQMEGLSSKWEKLQAKVSALSASLGEGGLVTVMKTVVLVLTTMVDGFQSFLNFDFGIVGTITELFFTFAASVTLGIVAIKVALIAWEALVAISLSLYLNIGKLITVLYTFYATLIANPILAIGVAIGTIIALWQTYNNSIKEGIDGHNKLANEAKQAANVLDLFQKSVIKSGNDADKLAVDINRLKSEFPELVKEIEKVAGVTNITTLSQEELLTALKKVEDIKLQKSLDEYTQAYVGLGKSLKETTGDLDEWNQWLGNSEEATGYSKESTEKLNEALKNISKTLIEQGHQVEVSLEKQREKTLEALDTYLSSNIKMEGSRAALTKAINDNFDKEDERLRRSKEFNQKQFNDIGQFYKDLSALERAEIQSTFDEQKKAEEKLQDMRNKKLISEEEYQSSLYATKMKYLFKELALIDENKKKQYETSLEKYSREIILLDKEIEYVEESLDKEKILYDSLASYLGGLSEQQEIELLTHFENIDTATESLEQKRREKSKVTYEYQKQLADDFLKTIQSNQKLQLSVLEGFENEKMRIEQVGAEAALKLIQQRIDAENDRFQKATQATGATEQQMLEHTERMKDLINQEVDARAEAIKKTVAMGQQLVNQLQEQMNKDLETTRSIYQTKSDIAKQHYANIVFEAQNALTKEYEEIIKTNKNEAVIDDLKLQAKIKYWDKNLELILQASEEESRIRQEEYDKSSQIIDQKLQVQTDYTAAVKGLWDDQSKYTVVIEQQQLESAQRLAAEQETYVRGFTSTFQSESGKRIQTIIDEAAVSGKSLEDQVNEHGIAYVKITGISKDELSKQKRDFIETKDGIFEIITKQTLKTQEAAVQETKAYKDGVEEKTKKSIEFVDSEIKRLGQILEAVKSTLASEYAEHEKIVENIKKLRESLVTTHEKVEDAIRKVRQTTMTEEKKYYDDIKIADEALNKARTTGVQKYVDDAWSKISSLATGTVKLDNGTQLSATTTARTKEKLMLEYEEIAKSVTEAEIKRQETAAKSLEETMKKHQETMDEIKKKLLEFQQLEIKLNTEKFTESIDKILVGIDDVVKKLKAIKAEAPVEIDISKVDSAINTVIGFVQKIKPEIEKIKQTPIEIEATGKDKVPINDYVGLIKGTLTAFQTYINTDLKPVVETAFKVTGYENKPINEVVEQIKTDVTKLSTDLKNIIPEVKTEFKADTDGTTKSLIAGVDEVKNKIDGIPKNTTSTHNATVTGLGVLQEAIDKITYLLRISPTTSQHIIEVPGLGDLIAALDYHNALDGKRTDSYHTVHVTTVNEGDSGSCDDGSCSSRTGGYISARVGGFIQHLKNGGVFSGKLLGYGGGDIVNAKLEPGEFVLRKESVKQIGVNALRGLNNLNSDALKSLTPKTNTPEQDSLFSGQLHTINLNIGDRIHKVYGESNVLNDLSSSMRRMRLMTA